MGLCLGQTFISPHSFSQATPFGVLGGGPEKDQNVCLWQWDTMLAPLGFVWPTGCPWA